MPRTAKILTLSCAELHRFLLDQPLNPSDFEEIEAVSRALWHVTSVYKTHATPISDAAPDRMTPDSITHDIIDKSLTIACDAYEHIFMHNTPFRDVTQLRQAMETLSRLTSVERTLDKMPLPPAPTRNPTNWDPAPPAKSIPTAPPARTVPLCKTIPNQKTPEDSQRPRPIAVTKSSVGYTNTFLCGTDAPACDFPGESDKAPAPDKEQRSSSDTDKVSNRGTDAPDHDSPDNSYSETLDPPDENPQLREEELTQLIRNHPHLKPFLDP